MEREKDLFELPDLPEGQNLEVVSSDDPDSEAENILQNLGVDTSDIYNLDVHSTKFQSLSQELQYDILSDMREKRKQNSWRTMKEMPNANVLPGDENLASFSNFQFQRLKGQFLFSYYFPFFHLLL